MATEIKSDLPLKTIKTNEQLIAYFDNTNKKTLEFSASEFDAVIGFFLKRGFETTSARTITQVLMTESKKSDIKIFELLDKLSGYNKTQLTSIVINVLNSSRDKTTQLGFKKKPKTMKLEERNIGDTITNHDRYSALDFSSISNTKNVQIGIVQGQKILLTQDDGEVS